MLYALLIILSLTWQIVAIGTTSNDPSRQDQQDLLRSALRRGLQSSALLVNHMHVSSLEIPMQCGHSGYTDTDPTPQPSSGYSVFTGVCPAGHIPYTSLLRYL
jgi:hypothetical protein